MNDFVRCNKLSGVYWLKEPVENLFIKIKLKPPDDILSLPKFEEFTNESNGVNLESTIEEHTFKWQEKVFSAWEIHRYSDVHNCISESELQYHESLNNTDISPSKVFSYVHDDYFKSLPLDNKIKKISSKMECLNLSAAVGRIERSFNRKSISSHLLFKSEEDVQNVENWCAMHVVLDNSDYNEDSQLLFKKETTLLSLYYNLANRYIIVTPDVNNLELNPYTVDDAAVPLGHKYEVDIDFGETENSEDLLVLLRKLQKKWERKHKSLVSFTSPPIDKVFYNVCFEILYATGFEEDDLYIEYNFKLPENVVCKDSVEGRTHTSRAIDGDTWHYGHLVELTMETSIGVEPTPHLYLEVISTDWWRRHRTEGYSHRALPLRAGARALQMSCARPAEPGGDQRRFFIGGCRLLADVRVLDSEEIQNTNASYTSTGSVFVQYRVVKQTCAPGATPRAATPNTTSALLMGAETALRKYKKARDRLAAASKDVKLGSGDT